MAIGPFANANETLLIQQISSQSIAKNPPEDRWQNNDSANRYYEAQKRADMYSKLKERRPMVIEYMKTPDKWESITMYINPDRLSITNQKVKGKAYTRAGIFYHHWGDDHPIMTLSGTTGLSGMKGIETLEEIYYASGTLLKYQKFGPEKYAQRTGQQSSNLNVNSPTSVMNQAMSKPTSGQLNQLMDDVQYENNKKLAWNTYKNIQRNIEDAQASGKAASMRSSIISQQAALKRIGDKYGFPTGTYAQLANINPSNISSTNISNMSKLSAAALNNYRNLVNSERALANITKAEDEIDRIIQNSSKKSFSTKEFKTQALAIYKKYLPDMGDQLVSELVSQKAVYYEQSYNNINVFNENFSSNAAQFANMSMLSMLSESLLYADSPIPYRDDRAGQIVSSSRELTDYLNELMQEAVSLETSEKDFFEQLKADAFDDVQDELTDEWKPRQVVIYYENRAYLGHFDMFTYNRDAMNPLVIRYDMKMTITKQILGTAYDPNAVEEKPATPTVTKPVTTPKPVTPALKPTPAPAPKPAPKKEEQKPPTKKPEEPKKYKVKKGDNLWSIARTQLGNQLRWKEIYNLNKGNGKNQIKDPHWIYPGQIFILPKK